jgi:hypothetical protein
MSAPRSTRHPGRGAGYVYQWEVATLLLLVAVGRRRPTEFHVLDTQLEWLGPVRSLHLEGDTEDKSLEDINLFGFEGRSLRIQVKERTPGGYWRKGSPPLVEFLARIVRSRPSPNERALFLSNLDVSADVSGLAEGGASFSSWYHTTLLPELQPHERPTEEEGLEALRQVAFSAFHPPERLDASGAPYGGILDACRGVLVAWGAMDPAGAQRALRHRVEQFSIQHGGWRLSREAAQDVVLEACDLRAPGLTVVELPLLSDLLSVRHVHRRPGPSWQDHLEGQVHRDEQYHQGLEELRTRGLLLVHGPSGAGKTVLLHDLAATRSQEHNALAAGWDFEHQGRRVDADIVRRLHTASQVMNRRPLLVLDNLQAAEDPLVILAAFEDRQGSMDLIVGWRGARDGSLPRLLATAPHLDRSPQVGPARGQSLLAWMLEQRSQLSQQDAAREAQNASWAPLLHDGWLLQVGVDSYERGGTVSFWELHAEVAQRLERTFAEDPGAEDLLYLVVGLGRLDIATERTAAAQVLGWPTRQLAEVSALLHNHGLVSVTEGGRTLLPWHLTLAELYWTCFLLHRQWAKTARARFRERLSR